MKDIPYLSPEKLKELTRNRKHEFSALIKKLKKKKPKNLDNIVHELHNDAFEKFDCLNCANCCRSISPIVTDKDIQRLAKHMKIKPIDFIDQYLYLDDDSYYAFKETPCPFLAADNYCMVYEYRPKACREYPHTDRKRFVQILQLTHKNCEVCPVVFNITKKISNIEW